MLNKWPIKYQLTIFLLILVCVPVIVASLSQSYFLKKTYDAANNKKFVEAREIWHEQVRLYTGNMQEDSVQIADNPAIIADLNLISGYQDSQSYRSDIFDRAKKQLNSKLVHLFQLTGMSALAIYTAEGQLVSAVIKAHNSQDRGIVTYQDQTPVYLLRSETASVEWQPVTWPTELNYKIDPDENLTTGVLKQEQRSLFLETIHPVKRSYPDQHTRTVGYLLLRKTLDMNLISEISSRAGVPLSLLYNGEWIGQINLDAVMGTLSTRLKAGPHQEDISSYNEHEQYYLQIAPVALANNQQVYLVLGVDKALLKTWMTLEYQIGSVTAIVTLLVCVTFGLFWARRIVTQPISELMTGVENVKKGDYTNKVKRTGTNEFGQLADAFNKMSEHILEREENLVTEKDHWQQIFNSIHDIILLLDQNLRVVDGNHAAADFFGKATEELAGMDCCDLFHDGDRDQCRDCPVAKVLNDLSIHTGEIHYSQLADKTMLVTASPVFGQDGQIKHIIYTGKDITETKDLQNKLQQAQKMEALGTLAGGIAHDFNNILAPIMGYSELLCRRLPQGSVEQDQQKLILNSALRAKELVKQILGFSRKVETQTQPLLLPSLIKETAKLLRSSFPSNIEIQLKIDNECGPVQADATNIHQILLNLCTNAAHAMRERGGILALSLDEVFQQFPGQKGQKYAKLTVSDSGCGMAEKTLQRAMEPYFTTKPQGEGTGLGLSIVHGIVTGANGQMFIDSQVEKGTTIDIFLPIYRYAELAKGQQETKALQFGQQENVLLVDDEKMVLDVTRQMLMELGYKVIAMDTPLKALQRFQKSQEQIDLIITDIMMPEMSGIELAGKIRTINPAIPIIFCSGVTEHFEKEEVKRITNKTCVLKPVNFVQLSNIIRKTINTQPQ